MYNLKRDYIDKNKYSRPGKLLIEVRGIVIHWTANPKVSAQKNRNYFNNLPVLNKRKSKPVFASAHEIIDSEEIVKAIPLNEVAYHISFNGTKNYNKKLLKKFIVPNYYTIGLEVVPENKLGKMSFETYHNLIFRTFDLLKYFELSTNDLYLHNDFTGKKCHKWFVDNPEDWKKFKNKIQRWLDEKNSSKRN